ncbi:DUF6678 family protein [Flavobacterium procerum]|uniref:DUF6678 family protein n=1 Tax=Flavobacterium procerum TaxID=1455569 RepID=A0ABV6BLJ9_9FLAO
MLGPAGDTTTFIEAINYYLEMDDFFGLKKYIIMTNNRIEKQIQKARETKTSCMSNTKWIKFFNAIETENVHVGNVSLKCLTDNKEYPFTLHPGIHENRQYTADNGTQGPVKLSEIEWIFVPAVYEIKRFNRTEKLASPQILNDTEKIKELLDALGKFEYEFDHTGIKLYGYK